MNKKRIHYLDVLKGLSIIMVVYCHYTIIAEKSILGNFLMCLASFGVPVFFMVSGGLLHSIDQFDTRKYSKRVFRIYFLIVIWKSIYFILSCLYKSINISILPLLSYLFLFGNYDGVSAEVLWFMYAYILVLMIYPISWFLLNSLPEGRKLYVFLMVIAFINGIFINSSNLIFSFIAAHTTLPELNINLLATVLPFNGYSNIVFYFMMGGFLVHEQEYLRMKYKVLTVGRILPFLMAIIGLLGLIEIKHFQAGTFRWANVNIVGGYSYASTVLLSIGIFLIAQTKNLRNSMIELIGRNTLGIYFLHFILLDFLANRYYHYLDPNNLFAMNTLKTIIVTLMCLIITLVLKKIPGVKEIVR